MTNLLAFTEKVHGVISERKRDSKPPHSNDHDHNLQTIEENQITVKQFSPKEVIGNTVKDKNETLTF